MTRKPKKRMPKWTGWPELWASESLHNFAIVYGEERGMMEMGNATGFEPMDSYQFEWRTVPSRNSLPDLRWQRIAVLK